MGKLRVCTGDFPPAEDIVSCTYVPKLNVMVMSMQGGLDGSAIGLYDGTSGAHQSLHRPSAPHQRLLVTYHSGADRLLVSDTKRLGARTDDGGVYLLESSLYQLHDKNTLNLELTRSDAAVLASGLRRATGSAHKDAAALVARIGDAVVAAHVRASISVPCAAEKISGLLASVKTAAKAAGALEELAVAGVLESRVDMAYKHRMNSELRRLLTFREGGWKHKYHHATPSALAQAGFFYESSYEDDDRTVCFACNTALVSWEPTDQPWEEHNRHFPSCAMLKGKCTYNISLAKYLASTRATSDVGSKIGALCTARELTMCVTIGSLRTDAQPGSVPRTMTLWDIEFKPRAMSTIPFNDDALVGVGLPREHYRCSRASAAFVVAGGGGEVLVILAKVKPTTEAAGAAPQGHVESPSLGDDATSIGSPEDAPAGAQLPAFSLDVPDGEREKMASQTTGVLLVYDVTSSPAGAKLLESHAVGNPSCVCTSVDGRSLYAAMRAESLDALGGGADTAGTGKRQAYKIVKYCVENSAFEPTLVMGEKHYPLDSRAASMEAAYDVVSDRHFLVLVLESGWVHVVGESLEVVLAIAPAKLCAKRVLCSRHNGILFACKSGDVAEVLFADIPHTLEEGAEKDGEADIDLDTAIPSSTVFDHYMKLSRYDESPVVQVNPLTAGWIEALSSLGAGHRTAWSAAHLRKGGRLTASSFELTLPGLFFVKDVQIGIFLQTPLSLDQRVADLRFTVTMTDVVRNAEVPVGSVVVLSASMKAGESSTALVFENSARGSLVPCQRLNVRVECNDNVVQSTEKDNLGIRLWFSTSCRKYDAKTGRRTTCATSHSLFAKRVAGMLCDEMTPNVVYRKCVDWLSWVQNGDTEVALGDLPLDESKIPVVLEQALATRDVETFEQLTAMLIQYCSISPAVHATVQRAVTSILPRVHFNSSVLISAYFDLIRVMHLQNFNAAKFTDALRPIATMLMACPTLPIRLRLNLNDVYLDANLTEFPCQSGSDIISLSSRARLGLFESHRLPLTCGAASKSCTFDASTGILKVANVTSTPSTMVFDCRAEILLTHVLIPKSASFRQLTIDVWSRSENSDAKRVLLAYPIHEKELVLTGICFRARFIKVALIPYTVAGGILDCSNFRGDFLGSGAIVTSAIHQKWQHLREEASAARAGDCRRLHNLLSSGVTVADPFGLTQARTVYNMAVYHNVTENEYRRALHTQVRPQARLPCPPWSPCLAYRFLVTTVDFLLEHVSTARLNFTTVTLDDCSDIFKVACLYGFDDTRESGARLAFEIAAGNGMLLPFMERLWHLVESETKRTTFDFVMFPVALKSGLLAVAATVSAIEEVATALVKQLALSVESMIKDGSTRKGASAVLLYQLDVLGWLLTDVLPGDDAAKPWVSDLARVCDDLFNVLLDESDAPDLHFVEASVQLFQVLASLSLPDTPSAARRAFRRFLDVDPRRRQSASVAAVLGPAFCEFCDRRDQVEVMCEILDDISFAQRSDREYHVRVLELVAQNFDVATQIQLSNATRPIDLHSYDGCEAPSASVDLPSFDPASSAKSLKITDNGARIKRSGSKGCYPAAILKFKDGVIGSFSVRVESSTHQGNSLSIGLGASMRQDYGDGFGHEMGSFGIVQNCNRKQADDSKNGGPSFARFFDKSDALQTCTDSNLGRRLEAGDIVSVVIDGTVASFLINGDEVASAAISPTVMVAGCTLHTNGVVSVVVPPQPRQSSSEGPSRTVTSTDSVEERPMLPLPAISALKVLQALCDTCVDGKVEDRVNAVSLWDAALKVVTQCCDMTECGSSIDVVRRLLTMFLVLDNVGAETVAFMRNLLHAVEQSDAATANTCIVGAIVGADVKQPTSRWKTHAVDTIVGFLNPAHRIDAAAGVKCVLSVAASAASLPKDSKLEDCEVDNILQHLRLIGEVLDCTSGNVSPKMVSGWDALHRLLCFLCACRHESVSKALEKTFEALISAWQLPTMWATTLASVMNRPEVDCSSQMGILLTYFTKSLAETRPTSVDSEVEHNDVCDLLGPLVSPCMARLVQSTHYLDVASAPKTLENSAQYCFEPAGSGVNISEHAVKVRSHHHRIASVAKRARFPNMNGPFRRWACDLCDDRQESTEERFRCVQGCDFDLCRLCSELDRASGSNSEKMSIVPLLSMNRLGNLFYKPVWYENETALRIVVPGNKSLMRLHLTIELAGCSTIAFRLMGGDTEANQSSLEKFYVATITESVMRSGARTNAIVLQASDFSRCRYVKVCFSRTAATQSFGIQKLQVYTCSEEARPKIQDARVWLSAVQSTLSQLSPATQKCALSMEKCAVVDSCMTLIGRGEESSIVVDVLRRLPQLCVEAAQHIPRLRRGFHYDYFASLIVSILTDDSEEVSLPGCDVVARLLCDDTVSPRHGAILASAASDAILRGCTSLRAAILHNVSSFERILSGEHLMVVSALLAASTSLSDFWSAFESLGLGRSVEHFSMTTFEILESMVVMRPSAAQFLFERPQGEASTLVDVSFQYFRHVYGSLVASLQSGDSGVAVEMYPMPSTPTCLLAFMRLLGAACVSPLGQSWFMSVFHEEGILLLLQVCGYYTFSTGIGTQNCITNLANLLEIISAANRESMEHMISTLQHWACQRVVCASVARKIFSSLVFGPARVAAIAPGNQMRTHFQISAAISLSEVHFLQRAMREHCNHAIDALRVGELIPRQSSAVSNALISEVRRGSSFLILAETDNGVRFVLVASQVKVPSATAKAEYTLLLVDLTNEHACALPERAVLCANHSTDMAVNSGTSMNFSTTVGLPLCDLHTVSYCTFADRFLQVYREVSAKSCDALCKFRLKSLEVFRIRVAQAVFPQEPFSAFAEEGMSPRLAWLPANIVASTVLKYYGVAVAEDGTTCDARVLIDLFPMHHGGCVVRLDPPSRGARTDIEHGDITEIAGRDRGHSTVMPFMANMMQAPGHLETLLRGLIGVGAFSPQPPVEQMVRQWIAFTSVPLFRGKSLRCFVKSNERAVPFTLLLTEWIVGNVDASIEAIDVTTQILHLFSEVLSQHTMNLDPKSVLDHNLFRAVMDSLSLLGRDNAPVATPDRDGLLSGEAQAGAASPQAALLKKEAGSFWAEGTGFGTGSTTSAWDRDEWQRQRQKEDTVSTLTLDCIARTLVVMTKRPLTCDIASEVSIQLAETSLAELLQDLLGNDSLIDISRNYHLFTAALSVLVHFVNDAELFRAIDKQSSFSRVLDTFLRTVDVLERALLRDSDKSLVGAYQSAAKLIRSQRPDAAMDQENDVNPDLGYCSILGRLQFGESDFAQSHHYAGEAEAPPSKCMERLMQELGSLATSLPVNEGSSIFVRYDPDRLNLMKALITGPEGTPYSGGCFEFDLYFPGRYPDEPPKVHLVTTGHGTVRFNPNLYKSGKVCLSILNTWPGRPEEQWSAHCTILQVLMSIQSLIFVAEPWFNEPGYERTRGTEEGDSNSAQYNRSIAKNTIRWAMVEQIRTTGTPAFARVIKAHFTLRRCTVNECTAWAADAAAASVKEGQNGAAASKVVTMDAELAQLSEVLMSLQASISAEGGIAALASSTDDNCDSGDSCDESFDDDFSDSDESE